MRLGAVLALIALVPAGVGAAPVHDGAFRVPLCGGGTVSIPLNPDIPGAEQPGCCAKGCQTGTRKRGKRAV